MSSPTTVPTGSVTFMDGGSTLGTVSLSAGKASYSTSTLTTGSHSIGAVYNGTVNVSGSTSAPLVETLGVASGLKTGGPVSNVVFRLDCRNRLLCLC